MQDYWLAFQLLRKSLGATTYREEIRRNFDPADTAIIPAAYGLTLKLPVSGILTLNLDRLATRAFSTRFPGRSLIEFSGKAAGNFVHVLKGATPFLVNLHGICADESSWVFTRDELKDLLRSDSYRSFIDACLCTRTVVFLGISADDIAVGGHLERLYDAGIDLGSHFWVSSRTDGFTNDWAEKTGVQVIRYSTSEPQHTELSQLLADLSSYQPEDVLAPPVTLAGGVAAATLRSPDELRSETSSEQLRKELNAYALGVLKQQSQADYEQYEKFCLDYDEAIYRAWYVTIHPPHNVLFDYELQEDIAEGAFGRVFRGKRANGEPVAVKVLKADVRRKREMLQSFRRGVRSMRILADHNVQGMVPYQQASEIPAVCVMEMIEGPNLQQAVNSGFCEDWSTILAIAAQLANIVRRAHLLPERVLHRDLRPPNIMLKDYYSDPTNINVVVLDFDLSWHLGADELSVVNTSTLGGYLAPEQVDITTEMSTRNAAVDSFGLGMTLYFLRTQKEPMYLQHLHKTWSQDLTGWITQYQCQSWRSVPRRYARLIENATKHEQTQRWDMGQIEGELELLRDADLWPEKVESSELITEELAQRTVGIGGYRDYQWESDTTTGKVELVSGVQLELTANESRGTVVARIEWSNRGDRHFKNIHKYLKPAIDDAVSRMQHDGWRILPETSMTAQMARFALEAQSRALLQHLDRSAKVIADSLRLFEF